MILGGHFQNFPACRSYQDLENSTDYPLNHFLVIFALHPPQISNFNSPAPQIQKAPTTKFFLFSLNEKKKFFFLILCFCTDSLSYNKLLFFRGLAVHMQKFPFDFRKDEWTRRWSENSAKVA